MKAKDENLRVNDFIAKLKELGEPTGSQITWAKRFCDFYLQQGLIKDDEALALCEICRRASSCWTGLPDEARPPIREAGISIPWIGSRFEETGICVLAINQNSYGGLGAHWWIRRGDMEERLANGLSGRFYYGASCFVNAVEASIRGTKLPREIPKPRAVADAWLSSAFLEIIKCSPRMGRSQPTAAMWRNCGAAFLGAELELLQPSVLIVLGRSHARDQLGRVFDFDIVDSRRRFERWRARLGEGELDVLCCGHPSWPQHWRGSWVDMIESLEERPLKPVRPTTG